MPRRGLSNQFSNVPADKKENSKRPKKSKDFSGHQRDGLRDAIRDGIRGEIGGALRGEIFSRLLPLAFIFTLLVGCIRGTDTGNPIAESPPVSSEPPGTNFYLSRFSSKICEKLTNCYIDLTTQNCAAGVNASTSLTSAMGLADYATLADAILAETHGELSISASNYSTCISVIAETSCQTFNALHVYEANNFNLVYRMLDVSSACRDL